MMVSVQPDLKVKFNATMVIHDKVYVLVSWSSKAIRETQTERTNAVTLLRVRGVPLVREASGTRNSGERCHRIGAVSCSPRSDLSASTQSAVGTAPICRISASSSKFSHSSTSCSFSKRLIVMPVNMIELPVGAIPPNSPLCVARALHRVTT